MPNREPGGNGAVAIDELKTVFDRMSIDIWEVL